MAADSGGTTELLHLEPFIHQVGGHSSMLQLNDNTICKPLILRERNFYTTSPDSLKEFMAEFRGVIEVTFSEDEDGYIGLTACIPSNHTSSSGMILPEQTLHEKSEIKTKHRIRWCESGGIKIESSSDAPLKHLFEEGAQVQSQNGSQVMNPWVLHCHQEQLNKMKKSPAKQVLEYILLENLTSKYQFPCILDLKMGRRQYGDDATVAKIQSHKEKVVTTTSHSLGVRICGMQVYHHERGHFICHNKYHGRNLTVEGFRQALSNFLHNGTKIRKDVIGVLLGKLNRLYTVIQSLDTFRFFTSSLLILYDSKEPLSSASYSNCVHFTDPNVRGVTLQFSDNGNSSKESFCDTNQGSNSNFTVPNLCDLEGVHSNKLNKQFSSPPLIDQDTTCSLPCIVDIRMIDFAHSTHSQMSDFQNNHTGPDEGYLFGLKNLISQLEVFQKEIH